jgi:hypothetical protein
MKNDFKTVAFSHSATPPEARFSNPGWKSAAADTCPSRDPTVSTQQWRVQNAVLLSLATLAPDESVA